MRSSFFWDGGVCSLVKLSDIAEERTVPIFRIDKETCKDAAAYFLC
jgi:hypothetical protein